MLKWYAETFKLTEKQMTKKALSRLKLLTLISLPATPLFFLYSLDKIPTDGEPFYIVLGIVSVIALLTLSFCKFTNRFWARDKYLDEWEVARKHQAMAFTLQLFTYVVAALMLFFLFTSGWKSLNVVELETISHLQIGLSLFALMMFFLYAVHIFILFTVNPIDETTDDLIESVGS